MFCEFSGMALIPVRLSRSPSRQAQKGDYYIAITGGGLNEGDTVMNNGEDTQGLLAVRLVC